MFEDKKSKTLGEALAALEQGLKKGRTPFTR